MNEQISGASRKTKRRMIVDLHAILQEEDSKMLILKVSTGTNNSSFHLTHTRRKLSIPIAATLCFSVSYISALGTVVKCVLNSSH